MQSKIYSSDQVTCKDSYNKHINEVMNKESRNFRDKSFKGHVRSKQIKQMYGQLNIYEAYENNKKVIMEVTKPTKQRKRNRIKRHVHPALINT